MSEEPLIRVKTIVISTSAEKHALIKAAAKTRGISISEYIRQMANAGFQANGGKY